MVYGDLLGKLSHLIITCTTILIGVYDNKAPLLPQAKLGSTENSA